jgi:hypothetical protein
MRQMLDEAERVELPDGLAHGHRAHVQLRGEGADLEARTGREPALENRVAERGEGTARERSVLVVDFGFAAGHGLIPEI